ncbi:MAG: LacI family DNA-binding transcriptional regulator [Kiritimatiellae bacterium]|jgi:LacI family transcriptional regulator|nr:LacI family DNA-binding transcriptional regulator [Kiritimatiellia bacterium]
MSRISLKMIADQAGVSKMTVSRALRDSPEIAAHTRERIQKLAAEMGYVADPTVSHVMQSFRTPQAPGYHETLGFVYTHPDWIPSRQAQCAKQTAETMGYKVEVIRSWEHGSPAALARVLKARGIRGVVLAPNSSCDFPEYPLPADDLSIVLLGSSLVNTGLPRVRLDYYQSVTRLIDEAHVRGYQRVALCVDRSFNERTDRSFSAAFKVATHPLGPGWAEQALYLMNGIADRGWEPWFRACQPDALLLGHGHYVERMTPFLSSLPHQPGIATLNAILGPDNVSGILHNTEEMVDTAIRVLVSWVRNGRKGVHPLASTITIPGSWREGETLPYVS